MTVALQRDFDDPTYLKRLRTHLLRFAWLQLRDTAAAKDSVQEALAAAWIHADKFSGRAEHKTFSLSRATSWSIRGTPFHERQRHVGRGHFFPHPEHAPTVILSQMVGL
jgi:DNA-directed RNA polymerase specialized sigma24 family protein